METKRNSLPFLETRELSRRLGERVLFGLWKGSEAVLRVSDSLHSLQSELELLASFEHQRCAELIDFGSLEGGGAYLVRAWIPGQPWNEWVKSVGQAEALAGLVDLAQSLEALHKAGFVHGDLKPENVIVQTDGSVYLTDFGLGARIGRSEAGGGSAWYLAPERLQGAPASSASDVFSLGVMLYKALGGELPRVELFYGRFPGCDFFEACGVAIDAFPTALRALLASLLARDPEARPASAAEVATRLASQAGLKEEAAYVSTPRWPRLCGVRDWVDSRFGLGISQGETAFDAVEIWCTQSVEIPWRFASECARRLWSHGKRAEGLELEVEVRSLETDLDLDAWASARAKLALRAPLLVAADLSQAWQARAAHVLCRAVQLEWNRAEKAPFAGLVLIVQHVPHSFPFAQPKVLSAPGVSQIAQQLQTLFPGNAAPEIHKIAETILHETAGDPAHIEDLLVRLQRHGWWISTPLGAGLRSEPWPPEWNRTPWLGGASELRSLSPLARRLGACLQWAGAGLPLADLARAVGEAENRLAVALQPLLALGWVRSETRSGTRVWAYTGPALTRAQWGLLEDGFGKELLAALAQAGSSLPWALRIVFGEDPLDSQTAIQDEVRSLRDRGRGSLLAAQLLTLKTTLEAEGANFPSALEVELALVQLAEGNRRAAEAVLQTLQLQGANSQVWRLEAHLASHAGQPEEAAAAFERAGLTEEALLERAHAAYRHGDHAALAAIVGEFEGSQPARWSIRAQVEWNSLAALDAMSQGHLQAAGAILDRCAARMAERVTDQQAWRPPLYLNRGHIHRRAGEWALARACYERSRDEAQAAGEWRSYAAALGQLGILLREGGYLEEACELLRRAQELRQRAGDTAGSTLVQGILGLVLLSQGQLSEGIEIVTHSSIEVRAMGRQSDATWLEISALLARLRLGARPSLETYVAKASGDPRIGLGLAQGFLLLGDGERALGCLDAAQQAFEQQGQTGKGPVLSFWRALAAGQSVFVEVPSADDENVETSHEATLAIVYRLLAAPAFDSDLAWRWAQRLFALGQWDKAARLGIAVWGRGEKPLHERAHTLVGSALGVCLAGLGVEEAQAARSHLLGIPDPVPTDLAAWEGQEDEDMDVAQILAINKRLVEQEDLPKLLGAIVEAALQVTSASRGFLVLEEHGVLSIDLAMDSSRGGIDVEEVDWSRTIVQRCLAGGGALRLADAGEDPDFADARSVAHLELRSILCYAFVAQEDLRGVIWVDEPGRAGAFDHRAERLLGLLAGQAALAIRQVRRLLRIRELASKLEQRVVDQHSELVGARRALLERGLTPALGGLVGESEPMRRVHAAISKIAPADISVLIIGESGTGKELVARALHDLSPRSKAPFVSENCAALPESLVEAELFGYVKGAFTGADRERAGLFERAEGGTLFLDEVGELPIEVQAKLLRALESRKVRRIGDKVERSVDFRLVVATNRDLNLLLEQGRFRADLLFRLDTVRIGLPPLSERLGDIPLLVEHFLKRAEIKGGPARRVAPAVLQRLAKRAWPGNVRELGNEIQRLCVFSDGDLVDPELVRPSALAPVTPGTGATIGTLAELERQAIMAAIEQCNGDKRKAAELLGISRAKVYQRLKEWGLNPEA